MFFLMFFAFPCVNRNMDLIFIVSSPQDKVTLLNFLRSFGWVASLLLFLLMNS